MGASSGKIVAVVGPTAAGKTKLSLLLAEALGGDVLVCDALQVREGLPILTAKPTAADQRRARHHLLGVLPICRAASAAQYVLLADRVIGELRSAGRTVVVSAGTGLYLRALVRGLFAGPEANPALRAQLRAEMGESGITAMHQRLSAVDPVAAGKISARDYVRIERALEVHMLTGRPISQLQEEERRQGPRYDVIWIGLDPGVVELRRRIEARADRMIEDGVYREVAELDAQLGVFESPPLGYNVVRSFFHRELSASRMREELIGDTARYAKRQRTWFRSEPAIRWYRDAGDVPTTEMAKWLDPSFRAEDSP